MDLKPGLDPNLVFSPGLTDVGIRGAHYQRLFSLTSLEDSSQPITFEDRGVTGKYLDLAKSYLTLKFKVKTIDDQDLTESNDVAILNLFGATCFQEVSVFLNDTLVSSCGNYGYLSYLKALLSFPLSYKNNQLRNSLYVFDEQANVLGEINGSYKTRRDWIKGSKLQHAIVPIFDDIFQIDKYIVPNVNLKVKLKRASSDFCLVSSSSAATTKYKVILEECCLNLHKIDVNSNISSIHEKLLEKNELSYPYTKSVIRTANFAKGTVNATISNIFNSQQIPELVCLAFVRTDSYNGKLASNCFDFSRNNVSSIQVQINNQVLDDHTLSVSDSDYLDVVDSLSRNLSLGYESIGLNRDNIGSGNLIYIYKLFPPEDGGSLSFQITFASGATENLTAIILGQAKANLNLGTSGVVVDSLLQ